METIQIKRCVHCMADLTDAGDNSFCVKCGKPPQQVEQPAYCMRPFSILRGKYLVGRMLGQGGFGITYVGFDMTLESKVAIKECYPSSMVSRNCSVSNQLEWSTGMHQSDPRYDSRESFLREARKMAKMQDISAVVRVRETFEKNNTAYIVMDFVEGITLSQWLKQNGFLPPKQCVEMLRPMMTALESVHRQGFIHRDISPDNIMVQSDGGLKLLDLGAAKDMERGSGVHSQLVAKNGFSPVEQYIETGEIGPWTDVYALCATMYYCMTGKLVMPALDRLNGEKKLEFDPKSFKEPLPTTMASTLQDGLALDHKKRIQSMTELLGRFDGDQSPKSGLRPQPKPIVKIVLASVAALLLVAVGVRLLQNFNKPATGLSDGTNINGEDAAGGLHVVELDTPNPNQPTEESGQDTPDVPADGNASGDLGYAKGWSEEMEAAKKAVVDLLGENYFPNMPLDPQILEGLVGITSDMYQDYLAEMPMISTNVDVLVVVKAAEGQVDAVEEALKSYRNAQVSNTMQYPQNIGKVQASKVARVGDDYVVFVLLGGDVGELLDQGDEAVITYCQEVNDSVVQTISEVLQ